MRDEQDGAGGGSKGLANHAPADEEAVSPHNRQTPRHFSAGSTAPLPRPLPPLVNQQWGRGYGQSS